MMGEIASFGREKTAAFGTVLPRSTTRILECGLTVMSPVCLMNSVVMSVPKAVKGRQERNDSDDVGKMS